MSEVSPDELKRAIESEYGGTATFVESLLVHENYDDQAVWERMVHIFDIAGHPRAQRAYAWSHEDSSGKRRSAAVLGIPGIDTPVDAVRVAIVANQKSGYPIIHPPKGSVVVFKLSKTESEEWLELTADGTLIYHSENAGAKFLRRGEEKKACPMSPEEAKRRWPLCATEIDEALAKPQTQV